MSDQVETAVENTAEAVVQEAVAPVVEKEIKTVTGTVKGEVKNIGPEIIEGLKEVATEAQSEAFKVGIGLGKELKAAELFGIETIEKVGSGMVRFFTKDWSGTLHEVVVKTEALEEKIKHTVHDDAEKFKEHVTTLKEHWLKKWK